MAEHDHDHDDHDRNDHDQAHKHPPQPDHREPSSQYELMGVALNELLIEKGVYSATELRDKIATIESVEPATHGARVIAKAWSNSGFKAELLADGNAAVTKLGCDPGYHGTDGVGEHAERAQRRYLHPVLLLSEDAAGTASDLVQERCLPLAPGA